MKYYEQNKPKLPEPDAVKKLREIYERRKSGIIEKDKQCLACFFTPCHCFGKGELK